MHFIRDNEDVCKKYVETADKNEKVYSGFSLRIEGSSKEEARRRICVKRNRIARFQFMYRARQPGVNEEAYVEIRR